MQPTFSSDANVSDANVSDANVPDQKEALMFRLPMYASAALLLGLAIAVGCPRAASAHPIGVVLDCGTRWDFCMQACSYKVPGGPLLGQCNDYCSVRAGICEASRIPRPASYRVYSRYPIVRK